MPFTNKEVQIADFLEQLHERIKTGGDSSALVFFKIFLQGELVKAIKSQIPDWDGKANAGDFDKIYPFAANILRDVASSNYSEHSNTYAVAHAVSSAFCEELNETFQCSGEQEFDLISIKSYVDMAAEAGVIEVKDGMVSFTPEGEEIAQSVERETKGGQN